MKIICVRATRHTCTDLLNLTKLPLGHPSTSTYDWRDMARFQTVEKNLTFHIGDCEWILLSTDMISVGNRIFWPLTTDDLWNQGMRFEGNPWRCGPTWHWTLGECEEKFVRLGILGDFPLGDENPDFGVCHIEMEFSQKVKSRLKLLSFVSGSYAL